MPVNVKVIRTKEFIKTTATGALDFASSKQALVDIASLITQPGEYEVLVDTRGAEVALSTIELFELGNALAALPSLHRSKIGILAPVSDMDNAKFFETVAVNRGIKIEAFIDFEEAMTWLIMSEQGN